MKNLYDKALLLSTQAHAGQKDRQGRPYIEHLIRVSLRVGAQYPLVQAAALLHDLMEDCSYTKEQLLTEGFPTEMVDMVEIVSRREESYEDFITRIVHSKNDGACRIKLADLCDNTSKDRAKLPKSLKDRYVKAIERLEPVLSFPPEALPASHFALSLSRVILFMPPMMLPAVPRSDLEEKAPVITETISTDNDELIKIVAKKSKIIKKSHSI